jgi:hypothetical protein
MRPRGLPNVIASSARVPRLPLSDRRHQMPMRARPPKPYLPPSLPRQIRRSKELVERRAVRVEPTESVAGQVGLMPAVLDQRLGDVTKSQPGCRQAKPHQPVVRHWPVLAEPPTKRLASHNNGRTRPDRRIRHERAEHRPGVRVPVRVRVVDARLGHIPPRHYGRPICDEVEGRERKR